MKTPLLIQNDIHHLHFGRKKKKGIPRKYNLTDGFLESHLLLSVPQNDIHHPQFDKKEFLGRTT